MKLQVAIDTLDIAESVQLVGDIQHEIDIVEIGTPLLLEFGMQPLQVLKEKFPGLVFLADTKIMDAGFLESDNAYKKGADIVTVLGVANDETIKGVISAAGKHRKQVMADMIGVKDIKARGRELVELGIDYVCVHTSIDLSCNGATPYDELLQLAEVLPAGKICVAGGIKLETMKDVMAFNPEIVIVGGTITGAQDSAGVTKKLKSIMCGEKDEQR